MEMKRFDPKLCHACKNRFSDKYVQCPYPIKSTSYCGRHKNYKYTNYLDLYKKTQHKLINNDEKDYNTTEVVKYDNSDDKKKTIKKLSPISFRLINKPSKNTTNLTSKQISIKNKLKLSLKNDKIINRMIENRNIFLEHQKDNNLVTILDYFFDPSLNHFSIVKLNNTFKHYKLEFTKDELIELIKLNNSKDSNVKKKIKKKKLEYTKDRIRSMFKLLFTIQMNMDKLELVQRNIKKYIKKKNIKNRGYAVYDRSLCVNDSDFNTLDPLKEIDNSDFYSYMDDKKFIYGFHIDSIYELFKRKTGRVRNPYNREYFRDNVRDDIIKLRRNKKKEMQEKQQKLCFNLIVKAKCLDVFIKIDLQGYYTNIDWLYNATAFSLKHFYRKLMYYWNHKLNMSRTVKDKILPGGDVINSNTHLLRSSMNKFKLLDKILDILDLVVSSAEDNNDKNLGCILVLHAISEISRECIESNPWLA